MKNDPIEAAVARLDGLSLSTPDGRRQLTKALAGKSHLVAAKAARLIGDRLIGGDRPIGDVPGAATQEFIPELIAAFDRFTAAGASLDKGCAASTALARALVAMECDQSAVFRRGMRHIQLEAVWGGSEDTAVDLRAVCAMGLANARDASTQSDKLRDLVPLLVDKEWRARAGAVRATASVGGEAATLLLRFKALTGDSEPDVLGDCVQALLELEGAAAMPLAAGLASSGAPDRREAAMLAMAASRRADAIEWLKERFAQVADRETRQCLLLALASSRTEAAVAFLLEVIRHGSESAAGQAVSVMAIHHSDDAVQAVVADAVRSRRSGINFGPG